MNLRRYCLAGAAAVMAGLFAGRAVGAEHEWKFFSFFGVNDAATNLHRSFVDDISKATDGRLKITLFAGGELPYKFSDVLRLVSTNQVQMGDLVVGLNAGELPGLNVFDLPFLCTSYDGFYKAVDKAGPVVAKSLGDKFGVGSLVHWTIAPQHIWLSRPIERIDDLKGRKIRIWTRFHADMLAKFGGSGVTISATEVTTALDRRIVDGAITAAIPALDWRFYDVAKTGYMLNMHMVHQIVIVNNAELAKLPADLREIVAGKSREWAAKYRKAIEDGEISALKTLVDKGEKLVSPAADDIVKARYVTRPIWDAWAKDNGPVSQELLAHVQATCTN